MLPPRSLQDALKEASSQASFGYCPANGEPALRKAPAQEMKHVCGADADVGMEDVALTAWVQYGVRCRGDSLADAGHEIVVGASFHDI